MIIYFVLGGPGSGKGTQCKLLENHLDCKHISAGDLLRKEKLKDTPKSIIINDLINNGQIVPSYITIELILSEIKDSTNEIILLDGFPRNFENLDTWMKLNNEIKYKCLYFDCEDEVLIKRLIERGKTSARSDDNIDIITKRLETYHNSTKPVIDYFTEKKLIHKINTNRDINIILNDLLKII